MKKKLYSIYSLMCFLFVMSCSTNDDQTELPDEEVVLSEEIEVYKVDKLENSLVLAVVNGGKSSYLVDKKGEILKVWDFEIPLGNDLELLSNGKLLGIFKAARSEERRVGRECRGR